jgi:hypothetical protein
VTVIFSYDGPSLDTTVYDEIALPPVAGAVHVTSSLFATEEDTDGETGACGTVVTNIDEDGSEDTEFPYELVP